jgi:Mg-chelatase subunit ChlD
MVGVELADGLTAGVEALWPLAVLGIAGVVLAFLVLRRSGRDRSASTRSRRLLFASRVLIVALLVAAAMGPYTAQTRETPGEPSVTMLVDESESMGVYRNVTDELVAAIEAAGVPVTTATAASGTDSRLGDAMVANLRENGTIVAVSDGRVTDGRPLGAVTETARSLNATVSAVSLEPTRSEYAVHVAGSSTASVGLRTEFTVSVSGVGTGSVPVDVEIDGETVASAELGVDGALVVNHTFEETGSYEVTASIGADDRHAQNDVFYRAVRVVERPEVLYVARGDFPLRSYLGSLYDVTNATAVPDDLDDYDAVVVQDRPAGELGNVSSLQEYVIGGGGLVSVGGPNAYEGGGYAQSPLATLLPVRVGNATGGSTNLAMAVDISSSTRGNLSTQKAIALDVLDQLGDNNRVGVVAFGSQAYRIADLDRLADGRDAIADRIRRLRIDPNPPAGGTDIGTGLRGAADLLGDRPGTIILLSDGWGVAPQRTVAVADQLRRDGHRVLTVGAGTRVNVPRMQEIAAAGGGSYFGAGDRDRLELLFGGSARQIRGDNLTVVTPGTFITRGVRLTANPGQANEVAVKSGADYQVATADATPAIASWRFGLGRVVSITAFGPDGGLDGLLERPDSLVVTKSVNYAVGDPSRNREGISPVGDARVGRQTSVTYRGDERPTAPNVSFRQIGEDRYVGELRPDRAGFAGLLGTTYAVNYPLEYAAYGESPALDALVDATGGSRFATDEPARIARVAREQASRIRTVRQRWAWLLLVAALIVFVVEVGVRRLQVYRGRTRRESGLP